MDNIKFFKRVKKPKLTHGVKNSVFAGMLVASMFLPKLAFASDDKYEAGNQDIPMAVKDIEKVSLEGYQINDRDLHMIEQATAYMKIISGKGTTLSVNVTLDDNFEITASLEEMWELAHSDLDLIPIPVSKESLDQNHIPFLGDPTIYIKTADLRSRLEGAVTLQAGTTFLISVAIFDVVGLIGYAIYVSHKDKKQKNSSGKSK